MTNFYIYAHIRLDTNEVFYIGKGCNKRAWHQYNRGNHWNNIVNKVGYKVEIIADNLTEDQSIGLEIKTITKYGRKDLSLGKLINQTSGGDGLSGHTRSPETKLKMSKASTGIKKTQEHKDNLWKNRYQYIEAIDNDGKVLGPYKSIKECSQQLFPETKTASCSIGKLIRGVLKSGNGTKTLTYKKYTFRKVV